MSWWVVGVDFPQSEVPARNTVLGCNIGDMFSGSALIGTGEFVRVGDDLLSYVRQPFHFATVVQTSRPEEDWARMTQRCDGPVDTRTLPALSLMMIGTFDTPGFEAQRAEYQVITDLLLRSTCPAETAESSRHRSR